MKLSELLQLFLVFIAYIVILIGFVSNKHKRELFNIIDYVIIVGLLIAIIVMSISIIEIIMKLK